MPHKFKIGQAVEYRASRGIYAPGGTYLVTARLPERDGEFEYRIRSLDEPHERIARESELSGAWALLASHITDCSLAISKHSDLLGTVPLGTPSQPWPRRIGGAFL